MLAYPAHWFTPEDWLTFIELPSFTRRWQQNKLGDLNLSGLQAAIMAKPTMAPVIPGTGGVRKLRFAPIDSDRGKSGGLRVCYLYVEEVATVILAIVYPKNEKDDLSNADKALLRDAVERVKRLLLSRPYRATPRSSAEDR